MLFLLAGTALAADQYELSLDGYYRVRAYAFNGLYDPAVWANEPGTGRYMQQRLRLQPTADLRGGQAKFVMMVDVFDDTVFGDNQSLARTPLFAEDGSNTRLDGYTESEINVKRAWMEFKVPVGSMRVGRQPSHWGMGLLANGGDGFDDTWGENHGGATFDRVLFVTKPTAVADGLFHVGNPRFPLYTGFAVDRLVEDPLYQYYGYECDPDDPDDDERCAADDDHGYVDDSRQASTRPQNWWTEHDDDVWEMVYLAIYRGDDLDFRGAPTDFTLGAYAVNRRQVESESNVWIYDGYLKFYRKNLYVESEWLTIRGQSSAIVIPGSIDPTLPSPLYKEPKIFAGAVKAGYQSPELAAIMEYGIASGDSNVADEEFTGFPIQPDYNVGLLFYEEILSRVSAARWQGTASSLASDGGVYNSWYLFPQVRYQLIPNWNLHGGFLVVAPHRPDGAVIQKDVTDPECGETDICGEGLSPILGWEADAALKIHMNEVMDFSLEYGYARPSDRLSTTDLGFATNGRVWSVQSRISYSF